MIDELAAALDGVLPNILAATGTPGVAVALATSTDLRTSACGYADLAGLVPMTGATVAPAGSLSKPLLGLGLMQLAETGELDPHAPIDEYLEPGTRPANPLADGPVCAVMLASHQGGYRADTLNGSLWPPGPVADYVRERHAIGRTPEYGGWAPLYTRTGVYSYSTFGMSLIGCAIERVAGAPYSSYVDKNVLAPIGLRDSAVPTGSPERSRWDELNEGSSRATGYMTFGGWGVPTPMVHSATYPAATLITSPADYARLLQALLRISQKQDGIVSPAGLAEMLTPRIARASPVTTGRTNGGIALELGDPAEGEAWWWGHSAAYHWGFWWDARVYPHRDLIVVAMGNKWDMMRYHNPATRSAPGLVCQWVAQQSRSRPPAATAGVVRPRSGPAPTTATSSWMGALVGERLYGTLGITERLSAGAVDAMTRAARPIGDTDPSGWDASAFAGGLDTIADAAPDPVAIGRYAEQQGIDAALWALECGATSAQLPMPVTAWAGPAART